MKQVSRDLRGHFQILLGAVLWSTGGACVKLLAGYTALSISSGRAVICALFFLLLLGGRPVCSRRHLGWIAGGAAMYCLVVLTFVVSTRWTTAANAILLQYTAPLWIAFLGWVALRERPSWRELTALVIGGVGVVLCASGGLTLFVRSGETSRGLLGDALALFSGLCFALMTVALRVLSKRQEEEENRGREVASPSAESGSDSAPTSPRIATPSPSVVLLFYGNFLTFLVGAPYLIRDLSHAAIPNFPYAVGMAVIVWHGMGQLGGGYWFYQRGLRTTRALTASLLCLIEPVLNPIWVAFLVGEIPSMGTRWGGVLVLISVVLSLTAGSKRTR